MARPLHLLALLAATAALPNLLSAQAFEGTLRMRNVTADVTPLLEQYGNDPAKLLAVPFERLLAEARQAGAPVEEETMTYQIKGSRLRVGAGGVMAGGYTITDVKAGGVVMVQPEQQAYIEWARGDVQRMMAQMRAMAPEARGSERPAIEPLSTTRTIAGRRCTDHRLAEEGSTTIACLSRELADLAAVFQQLGDFAMRMGSEDRGNELQYLARHGFPLLVQELVTDGDEQAMSGEYTVSELVSLERTALPDSLFAPPAGFKKLTTPTR